MGETIGIATFDTVSGADETLASLKTLKHDQRLTYDDAVVVIKDAEGEVSVLQTKQGGTGKRTAQGTVLGLVVGTIFGGPVAGALLGAAAGRYVGKHADYGISDETVAMTTDALVNGSSALFVLVEDSEELNASLFHAAMAQHGGTVHQVISDDNIAGDKPHTSGPDATFLRETRS
jgi:uncharacterized membrane protein